MLFGILLDAANIHLRLVVTLISANLMTFVFWHSIAFSGISCVTEVMSTWHKISPNLESIRIYKREEIIRANFSGLIISICNDSAIEMNTKKRNLSLSITTIIHLVLTACWLAMVILFFLFYLVCMWHQFEKI